ncbi:MAG: hypothetical protein IPI25_06740 [Candidatus Brocadia sp.]|nr:MAG: hypothetical protein IPI25_06740 [Candidatus Brocadia sp.]
MKCVIGGINKSLRGWYEYFQHSHKTTYPRIDD